VLSWESVVQRRVGSACAVASTIMPLARFPSQATQQPQQSHLNGKRETFGILLFRIGARHARLRLNTQNPISTVGDAWRRRFRRGKRRQLRPLANFQTKHLIASERGCVGRCNVSAHCAARVLGPQQCLRLFMHLESVRRLREPSGTPNLAGANGSHRLAFRQSLYQAMTQALWNGYSGGRLASGSWGSDRPKPVIEHEELLGHRASGSGRITAVQ